MNFPYQWYLRNGYPAKGVNYHGSKVFSCFACGGGSSMGYKLAGYDVIGCNEIDERMMQCYIENHNPKLSFCESIRDFKCRKHLPDELFNLDILDGSPPCSSFSHAGKREESWGKKKKFREGQSKQVLDTLFFDFIDLAKRLKPKIVVAENVKGLIEGRAKSYVVRIYKAFSDAGYYCQHFLLNASKMGVPQRRERVFFICMKKDLASQFLIRKDLFTLIPKINLSFNGKEIPFSEIQEYEVKRKILSNGYKKHWKSANHLGRSFNTPNGSRFGFFYKAVKDLPLATITSKSHSIAIDEEPGCLTCSELSKCGSYPLDYNFLNNDCQYLIGMSVPPVMMAKISNEIYLQWLSKLNQQKTHIE